MFRVTAARKIHTDTEENQQKVTSILIGSIKRNQIRLPFTADTHPHTGLRAFDPIFKTSAAASSPVHLRSSKHHKMSFIKRT